MIDSLFQKGAALLAAAALALGQGGCAAAAPRPPQTEAEPVSSAVSSAPASSAPAPEAAVPPDITPGTETQRGFLNDNVLHTPDQGDIHYSSYIPAGYDGSAPYALFVTLPGWEGLYFQGVGANMAEDFGVEALRYNDRMIVLSPQLNDWGETSARQAIALTEYFLDHYNIDPGRVYLHGQTRTLGKDLQVSAVGLGCMGFSHAYGAPTESGEAVRLLRRAAEMGYTFFDTAEVYGTPEDPHINEALVGEALAPVRDKVVIATKFGLRFDFDSGKVPLPLIPDSRPETIRRSLEGSLRRLRTDHIDLYFQHRIDPQVEPETVAGVMADLIREGKITHWGISEANEDYLRRANAVCPVTAVQNRYSMMARQYEALFPTLEELGVGLVAFSPMANGFLTGSYGKDSRFDPKTDYRAGMPQFAPGAIDQNQPLLDLLRRMAQEKQATPAQISLAWMLCKKPWIVPIPGTRKEARMAENAGAAGVALTPAEVAALDRALDRVEMSGVFGVNKN